MSQPKMTKRQETVMFNMAKVMSHRFEMNQHRESMPFPSMDELFARAQLAMCDAYRQRRLGSDEESMRNAADAANLLGLMVLFGK